ncbi:MAG: hypothetical protein PWQ46_1490, partial [Methanomicrobiaceae archaeon]|nr:hypothetical protein [Methanomicrobiaceae archaeon]
MQSVLRNLMIFSLLACCFILLPSSAQP